MKEKYIYFVLLLLAIPASFFLLRKGFYEPHDLHHFADIYEMYRAFSSGQIPPRWGPDFLYGFGYPLFNFYYPLPFYLGSLFLYLTGSIQLSFKLVFFTSILISLTGIYLFLREFVGKYASIAGSALFLYTPYRAVQVYVRGAMGEALGLSLMPLVAWSFVRLVRNGSKRDLAVASLVNALFILSHNYLWVLSYPFIFLLLLMITKRSNLMKKIKNVFYAMALSFGLCTYWLVPALVEQSLVSSKTPFPLIDHFPFVRQLIIPSWGYGSSVWGPGDEISFQIGLVNLIVILLTLFYLLKKRFGKDLRPVIIWTISGFFISLVFMNIRTYPIWKLVPFNNFIQFPWRLLIFTTFFTSVAAAFLVENERDEKRKIYLFGIVGASIVLTLSYFRPSEVFYKSDNDYLSRFFANRTPQGYKLDVSDEYKQYSEDYLLLPKWVEEKPDFLPEKRINSDAEILSVNKINSVNWNASVNAEQESFVSFYALYFPGWNAKVDGIQKDMDIGKPYGQIEIIVPEGRHDVEFYWNETRLRKVSDLISFFSLVLLGAVYKKGKNG